MFVKHSVHCNMTIQHITAVDKNQQEWVDSLKRKLAHSMFGNELLWNTSLCLVCINKNNQISLHKLIAKICDFLLPPSFRLQLSRQSLHYFHFKLHNILCWHHIDNFLKLQSTACPALVYEKVKYINSKQCKEEHRLHFLSQWPLCWFCQHHQWKVRG